jgi:predicted deacetylase
MNRWVFVRCRMRGNRPEFTTDDVQVVVKELQRFADSKNLKAANRYPTGQLEHRELGDRLMFYCYDRYGVRNEFACLKLITTEGEPGTDPFNN